MLMGKHSELPSSSSRCISRSPNEQLILACCVLTGGLAWVGTGIIQPSTDLLLSTFCTFRPRDSFVRPASNRVRLDQPWRLLQGRRDATSKVGSLTLTLTPTPYSYLCILTEPGAVNPLAAAHPVATSAHPAAQDHPRRLRRGHHGL